MSPISAPRLKFICLWAANGGQIKAPDFPGPVAFPTVFAWSTRSRESGSQT